MSRLSGGSTLKASGISVARKKLGKKFWKKFAARSGAANPAWHKPYMHTVPYDHIRDGCSDVEFGDLCLTAQFTVTPSIGCAFNRLNGAIPTRFRAWRIAPW